MKRQLLSFLLLFAFSANINAQTVISGSFDCLSTEKAVCIKWDFTNTVFEKKIQRTRMDGTEGDRRMGQCKERGNGLNH